MVRSSPLDAARRNRRIAWAAAGVLALVVSVIAILVRPPAKTPSGVVPALAPIGAPTSIPFAAATTAEAKSPAREPSLAELTAHYATLHDRAARFALMKDRPEPEAKYLAYRAFHECGRVMSSLRDANDLGFAIKRLWAEQNVTDIPRRQPALDAWTSACRGFLRPNPDVSREAKQLLDAAVAADHIGARALAYNPEASDPVATRALAEAIAASGDLRALFDGYMVMIGDWRRCSYTVDQRSEFLAAWILAACRLNDCHSTDLFFAYGMCALQGACSQGEVERTWVKLSGPDADARRLQDRIALAEAHMRSGRADLLLACTQ